MYAWIDDLTEVGLLWEILKVPDAFGRRQRVYQKRMLLIYRLRLQTLNASCVSQTVGEFDGHYSGFAFNPASGLGTIVLMTGTYRDTESTVIENFKHFQPAFDVLQVKAAIDTYAGHWRSKDGESEALISVVDGSLWLDKYSLKGNDLLAILRDDTPEKIALASTGRKHEFRYVVHFYPFKVKN